MKHLAILGALLAVLAVAVGPAAARSGAPSAPAGLRAFLLRVDEPVAHSYPRTPAFAWSAVRRATSYELELSTSRAFTDATIVWKDADLATPTAAIDLQLPWMTGEPYALWAHVRAVVDGHTTAWGKPFGFNMRWESVPRPLPSPSGLIRWTPVDGATGYDVWFPDLGTHFSTVTNVADEREFFRPNAPFAGPIRWRVRAIRYVASSALPNSLDRVSHGPYTQRFSAVNAGAPAAGPLDGVAATSDGTSSGATPIAHQLTPGFAWRGTDGIDGRRTQLWRVYVSTDRQCVNVVMKGYVVGGPAWAPRTGADPQKTFMADDTEVIESEPSGSDAPGTGGASSGTGSTGSTNSPGSSNPAATAAPHVDLWDIGWPTGRYWWTVVPVVPRPTPGSTASNGGSAGGSAAAAAPSEYIDTELPEDACAEGRVWSFGKVSAPVATATTTPYASGVASGRQVTAAAHKQPRFRSLPLIAWQPALGAQLYDVEVSRTTYPWKPTITQQTHATSLVLPLSKNQVGTWYYRVRGVNPNLPDKAQTMTWSKPVPIRITGDVFTVAQ